MSDAIPCTVDGCANKVPWWAKDRRCVLHDARSRPCRNASDGCAGRVSHYNASGLCNVCHHGTSSKKRVPHRRA